VATDTLVDIASAHANGLGHAYALACQQATHLLQPGPRGRNESYRSTWQVIGETQGDAVEYRRTTIGSHHQHALLRCQVF
jgi:hypothetical protein